VVTVLKQGQVLRRTLQGRLRRATQWRLGTKLSVSVLLLAALSAGLVQVGGVAPSAGLLVVGLGLAWWLRGQAVAPLTETIGIANRLAAGDVGQTVSAGRNDETGMLKRALSQLKVNLQALVGDVREQVEGIEVASQQISAGSSDLSSRTETQAANLQQTAASLEQISGNVQNNSRSAEQANALAERARSMAADSAQAVAAAVQRMEDIQKASARIAEITQVVDALSFQTNLLSLNAAVEAARAGDAGRGFAVVASEVRALAARTRDASKEIKQLIEASVAQVSEGARSVEATGRSVEETRQTIEQVSTLVGEISVASKEQAQGVEQVHQAVAELDSLTQQNAAMVEELSAAAASLSTQAAVVASAVKIFRA
jgi:aerotaxis receptor